MDFHGLSQGGQGVFLVATRMLWAGSWQLAGSVGRHAAAGFWFAAVPEERWPADPQKRKSVRKLWHGQYGDRRQELVFIGIGMDEPRLRAALDACLLANDEWCAGVRVWARLPDRFPHWSEEA